MRVDCELLAVDGGAISEVFGLLFVILQQTDIKTATITHPYHSQLLPKPKNTPASLPPLSTQPGHGPVKKLGLFDSVVSQGVNLTNCHKRTRRRTRSNLLADDTRSAYRDCSRLEPVLASLRLVLGTVGKAVMALN